MGRSMGDPTRFDPKALARPRVDRFLLARVALSVTERDKRICLDIYEHRFLTTLQAARLHFSSHSRARNRLMSLFEMRVLERFRPRRESGSHPWHYVLDEIGLEIVAGQRGVTRKDLRYDIRKALRLAWSQRLAHMRETNDFFSRLAQGLRKAGGGRRLGAWWGERRLAANWNGLVRPDGYGQVDARDGRFSFFLELDGGTETGERLAEKLYAYQGVAAMPDAPDAVLFCFPSRGREANAREALGSPGVAIATAVLEDHMAEPLAPIWLPLAAEERWSLLDLPRALRDEA